MPKILLIQGPNMAFLGRRQPELYGTTSAAELDAMLQRHAQTHSYQLEIFYTNIEGAAIDRIYRGLDEGTDGLLMNPAGCTRNGYALLGCIRAIGIPYIEIHMRLAEDGLPSIPLLGARGVIAGFGIESYVLGLEAMLRLLDRARPATGGGRGATGG